MKKRIFSATKEYNPKASYKWGDTKTSGLTSALLLAHVNKGKKLYKALKKKNVDGRILREIFPYII